MAEREAELDFTELSVYEELIVSQLAEGPFSDGCEEAVLLEVLYGVVSKLLELKAILNDPAVWRVVAYSRRMYGDRWPQRFARCLREVTSDWLEP